MYATVRFSFLPFGNTEAIAKQWPSIELDVSESLSSESLVSDSLVSELYGLYLPLDPVQRDQGLFPRLGTGSSGRRTLRRHNLVLQLHRLMWNRIDAWCPLMEAN